MSTKVTVRNFASKDALKDAVGYGFIGLFAYRDKLSEAYKYGMEIIDTIPDGHKSGALVAFQVFVNTNAIIQVRQKRVMEEALEMQHAIISYCQQDSHSPRRRKAMIEGAKDAIRSLREYI